jgi:hypothetical protein
LTDLDELITPLLALFSTDTWMEDLIKKKRGKSGKSLLPSLQPEEDEFEELYRFLRQPRLRREDCPNPIPWWGVSIASFCVFNETKPSVSTMLKIQCFV